MHEKFINISMKKIRNGDYNIRPFIANKEWKFSSDSVQKFLNPTTDTVDFVWSNVDITFFSMLKTWIEQLGTTEITLISTSKNSNIDKTKISVFRYFYPENDKYFGNVLNISSSLYSNTFEHQQIDPKLIWYYLDHNFYRDNIRDRESSLITDKNTNSYLSETGSILVLPRILFGEGLQKNTFEIKNFHTDPILKYTIIDDGIGNLIDTSFDKTKFVNEKNNILYLGFNEKYREYNFINKKLNYVLDYSNNMNNVTIHNVKKISYHPGIKTNDTNENTGTSAHFTGSFLEIENTDLFNFSNDMDFATSFWIKIPQSQSIQNYEYNPIFNKKTIKSIDVYNVSKAIFLVDQKSISEQYPFDIQLNNHNSNIPNTISFKQSSAIQTVTLTSNEIQSNEWNHILCQKSGSNYELWVNGVLEQNENISIIDNVQNNHKFFIAGNGSDNNFYGSLDEIRFFNKALTQQEITSLSDNSFKNGYAYQTDKIGNLFYDLGIAVISDPRPKYKNTLLGKDGTFDYENLKYGFEADFNTTTTFYEHEVVCKIPKGEFNTTQNPTTIMSYNKFNNIKSFVTGSSFSPYITTIGLYNDNHDLVAIAKLATPLKKRKDIDMNVIIRFDM